MAVAYKLFTVNKKNKGKLFPLYINTDVSTPIGEWVEAESGPLVDGKVKSKLGLLCYRPGWHLSDIPIATHMGVKDESGRITYMRPDVVWCECEYSDEVSYQEAANKNGTVNGKFVPKLAYIKQIPYNGFYKYKTNPNMLGEWILAGAIKVKKILSDNEVDNILMSNGIVPMERYGGELVLDDYGF